MRAMTAVRCEERRRRHGSGSTAKATRPRQHSTSFRQRGPQVRHSSMRPGWGSVKHRMERPQGVHPARTLAEALWFPVTLFLGLLFCLAPALHAPQPHNAKVVVAHSAPDSAGETLLQRQHPGGFVITAVAGRQEARRAVLDRDAVAGYVPGRTHGVLYVAKANGM